MYCYKLNNSYTTYVNYTYLNECIKASKPTKAKHNALNEQYLYLKPLKIIKKNKPSFKPLPDKTILRHKVFGDGTLISTNKNGTMEIAFGEKIIRFLYPDAIKQGYLSIVNL